jgi:hypothetical protein
MGFQPGSTCLRDPETQLGKISRAMRIRIDTDQHTLILGVLALQIEQVHALRLRIELQTAAPLSGRLDDGEEVQVQGLALIDQPTQWVRQNREIAMVDSPEQAPGLLASSQIEMTVDGTHHEVQAPQNIVWQIQATVFENVDLDTLEQGHALQPAIERIDLVDLLQQPVAVQTMGHPEGMGVIGDCQVLQARGLRRKRHIFQAVAAIRLTGMGMQVTFEIA